MNIRKIVDYSAMYAGLDQMLERKLSQMELYFEIGKLVSSRKEKGAAVAAAKYLAAKCPNSSGFSPRNLRRMRDFFRTYESATDILREAFLIGWTQNVVILEANLTMEQRQWYIRAASKCSWSKMELLRQINDFAHEKMDLDVSSSVCYNSKNMQEQDGPNTEDSSCELRQNVRESSGQMCNVRLSEEEKTFSQSLRWCHPKRNRRSSLSSCRVETDRVSKFLFQSYSQLQNIRGQLLWGLFRLNRPRQPQQYRLRLSCQSSGIDSSIDGACCWGGPLGVRFVKHQRFRDYLAGSYCRLAAEA